MDFWMWSHSIEKIQKQHVSIILDNPQHVLSTVFVAAIYFRIKKTAHSEHCGLCLARQCCEYYF